MPTLADLVHLVTWLVIWFTTACLLGMVWGACLWVSTRMRWRRVRRDIYTVQDRARELRHVAEAMQRAEADAVIGHRRLR